MVVTFDILYVTVYTIVIHYCCLSLLFLSLLSSLFFSIASLGKHKTSGLGDLCIFVACKDLHYLGHLNNQLNLYLKSIQFFFRINKNNFSFFPISNQKATQGLQVRVQAILQPKKNMKSGSYMVKMVKKFMYSRKKNVCQLEYPSLNLFSLLLFYFILTNAIN